MAPVADKVIALLKSATGPGDVLKALAQDPLLLVGILSTLAMIYLLGRIYIWPTVNPFQIQWIANFWGWLTSPNPPTPQERYPYAKVTYVS
jgi:hypothetical protein